MKQDSQVNDMGAMQESFENFYNALQNVEKLLTDYKESAQSQADGITAILKTADTKLTETVRVKANASGLEKQMAEALSTLKNSIGACQAALEEKSRVRATLDEIDSETRAKVIVFGRTNAGKSTLGNFLRGKTLREAAFNNPWKNGDIPINPIKVIESADGEEIEKEEMWFKEGSTETTREIQCFMLPGLLWVDTPGIGSINDDELGALARKYADNADLVLYLDHSDNPGLQSFSGSLMKLLDMGKETLILINQSDKTETARENGKIVFETDSEGNRRPKKIRIPKPEEDRRAQEAQVIKSLLAKGFNPDVTLSAMSISMLLAKMAVENNNDVLYEGSAIGKFLDKLANVFTSRERIGKIMSSHVYSACLDLCSMALVGPDKDVPGLNRQIETQEKFLEKIKSLDEDFDIKAETAAISTQVINSANSDLRKLLSGAMDQGATSQGGTGNLFASISSILAGEGKTDRKKDITLNLEPLLEKIQNQCDRLVSEKITSKVKELFASVEFKKMTVDSSRLSGFRLQRQTEIHEYEVPEAYSYRREPSGFWEHVCGFFGKSYYGTGKRMVRKTQTIDLGYNLEEVKGKISALLPEMIEGLVQTSLTEAKNETLGYARDKVEKTLSVLREAKEGILQARSRVEAEMRKAGA